MDGTVIGDVVTVVAQGRRKKRHQPDGIYAQFLHVIELLGETLKVADAIAIAVEERANVDLVDDGLFVPARLARDWQSHVPPRDERRVFATGAKSQNRATRYPCAGNAF
jgi:hypothetical protein